MEQCLVSPGRAVLLWCCIGGLLPLHTEKATVQRSRGYLSEAFLSSGGVSHMHPIGVSPHGGVSVEELPTQNCLRRGIQLYN